MNARPVARKPHTKTRTIALLGFEGCAALDLSGPHEVFALASYLAPSGTPPPYRLVLLAERAGSFRAAQGFGLIADASWHEFREPMDTLIVADGPDMTPVLANRALLAWLRTMSRRIRRMGSICTGAFALAEAGLLDERRATTHWIDVERLAGSYPKVKVDPDAIYVRDGTFFTSAGITAGMDLALALVEEDLGRDAALAVARMLVMYLKRPGGQSQFSMSLQAQATEGRRLAPLLSWLSTQYREPITVDTMAERAAMSAGPSRGSLSRRPATPRPTIWKSYDWSRPSACWKRPASLWMWRLATPASRAANNCDGHSNDTGGSPRRNINNGSAPPEPCRESADRLKE